MRAFDFDPRQLRRFDPTLVAVALALAMAGVVALWGSSGQEAIPPIAKKQLVWIGLGLAAFTVCCFLDIKALEWISYPLYAFAILLLIGLFPLGHMSQGSHSWYRIGPLHFQPSELAKIATAMALARHLARHRAELRNVAGLFTPGLIVAVPAALTLKQNDTGTALVFLPLFFSMVYLAGLGKRVLTGLIAACALCVVVALPRMHDYQLARVGEVLGERLSGRLMTALGRDPARIWEEARKKSGWHIEQAVIALGSGRVFGKGWGKGTQTALAYLPTFHTDFIFSSLGEQFGFAGCALVILGFAILVWRSSRIALGARDMYGSLLTVGLLAIFISHIIVNLGMVLHMLPIIGLPLPFLSYGGSFMLSVFIIFGLVANVGMRRYLY